MCATNTYDSARTEEVQSEEKKKTLIVLGDEVCGKTSLIARLKGVDFDTLPNCLALDYTYMDMVVEDDDEYVSLGRLDVWQLSGNPHFGPLLTTPLSSVALDDVAFLICLPLDKPWTLSAALKRWLGLVARFVERTEETEGSPEAAAARRTRMEEAWRSYAAPGEDEAAEKDGEPVLMPLAEGALEENYGVPIVVAVCKADAAGELQSQYAYKDAHFDYIQQVLRSEALNVGAGLIYTSAIQGGNTAELLQYLQGLYYNRPVVLDPQVVEKEAVFVPAGWDSLSKIAVLGESSRVLTKNKTGADGGEPEYEEVIKEPFSALGVGSGADPLGGGANDVVEAEDDQEFLQRFREFIDADPAGASDSSQISKGLSDLLSAGKKKTQTAKVAAEAGAGGRRPSLENILAGAKAAGGADSPGGADSGAGSEEVLSSFFSSLMNKGGAASSDQRTDVKKALAKN